MSMYDCIRVLDSIIPVNTDAPSTPSLQSPMIGNIGIDFSLFASELDIGSVIAKFKGLTPPDTKGLEQLRNKLKARTEVPTNYENLTQDIQEIDRLIADYETIAVKSFNEIDTLIAIKKELQLIHLKYVGMNGGEKTMDTLLRLRCSCSEGSEPQVGIVQNIDRILSAPTATEAREQFNNLRETVEALDPKDTVQLEFKSIMRAFDEKAVGVNNKYQQYLVAEIYQGSQYELGSSRGECYGFTMAMADSSLSPYGREKGGEAPHIKLTDTIHNYQTNQDTDNDGLQKIQRTDIRNKKLCVGALGQAKNIVAMGKKHKGEHILITLEASISAQRGHSCYFNYLENGKIRYTDSNDCAYEFDNEQVFLNHYQENFKALYERNGATRDEEIHFLSFSLLKERKEKSTSLADDAYKIPTTNASAYAGSILATFHNFQTACLYPIAKIVSTLKNNIVSECNKQCTEGIENFNAFKQNFQSLKNTSEDKTASAPSHNDDAHDDNVNSDEEKGDSSYTMS